MRFSLIPFLLLAVPLAEIAAFVVIGGQIGVWATLGMVLFTAILGSFLLRWQGVGLFNRINAEMRANRVPGRELVHGVMILIAGVLLLTPGFVTDSLGFLLFVPAIRDGVWRLIKDRIVVQTMGGFSADPRNPGADPRRGSGAPDGVVDLNEDEYERTNDSSSPWSDDRESLTKPGRKDGGSANGL
ncbi:FxsA family protein [Hoeflea ulvae]|uniref:Membrane protein FxsA n=1 Tax=Hoeflea ulvae TaxID=2983764 RepID=A0ABT3YAD2_9HYPH|nr:FxsA family protein [Hoeflea ulvae]MCY0092823.1 membrane protein FxsA [Hoeflea ulvae]